MELTAISLFEEYDHWVADVQANVAAVVVRYRVATFLDNEAVPVTLVPPIKIFLDLTGNVTEVARVVILERFQTRDDRRLLLVHGHVSPLNQYFSVSVGAE